MAVAGVGMNAFIQHHSSLLAYLGLSTETIVRLTSYDGWRLMMMLGTTPALLTVFFRLFVPESHKWEAEDEKGTTSHWATADLFGVLIGALALLAISLTGYMIWVGSTSPDSASQNASREAVTGDEQARRNPTDRISPANPAYPTPAEPSATGATRP